jgi:hypothetical protein
VIADENYETTFEKPVLGILARCPREDSPALQAVLKNSDQYSRSSSGACVRHSIIYKSGVSPVSTEMHKPHTTDHNLHTHTLVQLSLYAVPVNALAATFFLLYLSPIRD